MVMHYLLFLAIFVLLFSFFTSVLIYNKLNSYIVIINIVIIINKRTGGKDAVLLVILLQIVFAASINFWGAQFSSFF